MASAAHDSERPGPSPDFQLLIDSAPALIHTSLPDGYLDFFNQSWLEYVGRSLEDVQGWKWTEVIHPEDVEGIVAVWRESLASGKPFLYEARVRRADGEYRWMLHHKVAIRDEHRTIVKWHGSSIDIQDRKHAEEKIREQEVELRQVLNLTPQHVHVLTADGRLLYSNEVALQYHGSNLDDWSPLPLSEWRSDELPITLFHPDDRERVLSEFKNKLLSGSPDETEGRLRGNDGRYLWFLFRYSPLRDQQGQVVRWYVAGTEIEERKQVEQRLHHENIVLREEIDKASMFEEIVGTSPTLKKVLSRVSKVGPTDSTVLLTGETGTGKELIARAIHKRSRRSSRPFVSVNCAAVPRDLIASELFGHEKGAFTGALQRRLGRFELAESGTIFLDEVGELTLETQVALLRVLQEREFERVGGNQSIPADVRVIAATNRNLEASIAAGTFRRDLFYRLNVFPIEIPPLRERKEDISMLVEYFIGRYGRNVGKRIRSVEKTTMDLLSSYSWPGNIRELQNVVERSIIVCETETFSVDPSWLSKESQQASSGTQTLGTKSAAQEKETIEAALTNTGGRVSGPLGAAAALGIPASTLESKIRTLGINKFRFKNLSR
jgi:formate hydrogenlyase transcriptional activator